METQQPIWSTCPSFWSLQQLKKKFLCLNGIPSISVHAYCLVSFQWTPGEGTSAILVSPSHKIFLGINESSPAPKPSQALSASPCITDASVS